MCIGVLSCFSLISLVILFHAYSYSKQWNLLSSGTRKPLKYCVMYMHLCFSSVPSLCLCWTDWQCFGSYGRKWRFKEDRDTAGMMLHSVWHSVFLLIALLDSCQQSCCRDAGVRHPLTQVSQKPLYGVQAKVYGKLTIHYISIYIFFRNFHQFS